MKDPATKGSVGLIGLALVVLTSGPAISTSQAQNSASPPQGMPFKHGLGYEQFQQNCAQCHGPDLAGTGEGPPLVHGFYKPSHHGDVAFYRAISQGSPQHHWNFGDMPPVEGVDESTAEAIVEFVRWFQRESGLY